MSDLNDLPGQPDELELLKNRAKQMGINFHPSIGIKKLRSKVSNAQKGVSDEDGADAAFSIEDVPNTTVPPIESRMQKINRLRKEAGRQVRIRVSCMNPNKREWEGEVYTVSNSVVGTFKKYVPFNAENGWHVPAIILKHMQEKECQVFHTVKNDRGQKVRVGKMIKELNIEVLEPLTRAELDSLAQRQAMASGNTATMA